MKKLMTLLSAAAVAFGLQAADTGTSFEGMSAGDLDITSSTDELAAGTSGYWVTNGNEKVSLTVTAGLSLDRENPLNIPQFKEEDQDFYLSVKSPFGNPVTRKIKAEPSSTQLIGNDGFYFDSLVKFTAFDEDPMTTAVTNDFDGAKIAVWIQEVSENEVVTGTNLYVRAGYLGGQPQTYDCGRLLSPDGWKRLTIKAIKNIYVTGSENNVPAFVVFINGEPVGSLAQKGIVAANLDDKYEGYNITGSLFPSLAQTGDESDVLLSSVSYDGQGDVDDLVFTATAPKFARDAEYVYIKWTPADITALTIDGTDLTSEQIAAGSYKVTYADDLSVAVSATYVEGKLDGTWTTTGGATVSDGTFSFTASEETGTIVAAAAAASFNGTPFADLADAITAANEAGSSLPAPVLKLFKTTSEDEITIENENSALVEIDLNGQTNGNITALSPLSIVDSVGGGVVAGTVYFDAYGSIAAGTYNASVTFGSTGSIAGGRFLASANTASALNPYAPEGKEFGVDGDYLVLVDKSQGEPTIEPGDTSIDDVQAESAADATNKVVVASPDSTVVSDADYKEYFTLTAQETATGVYTVSIALNEEAIELPETLEDVGGDLQDAAAAFGEDEDASFTGIAAKPGLWYWIDTATDPAFTENVTHGTAVFATGDTVNLEAIKPDNADNAVFFRVCVDTVQRVW